MRSQFLLSLAAGTAALSFAAPAFAQDSERAPFSGPYVAGSVGYDFQGNDPGERIAFDRDRNGTFGDTVVTSTGANAFSPGYCDGRAQGVTPAANGGCENDRSRISYHGRVGYDQQFGNIVAGVVGEFGKTNIRDYVSAFSTTPASYTFETRLKYNAAVRARVGYAADKTLFYATGGGAYGKLGQRFYTSNTANSFTSRGKSDGWGYTAGGGIEQKISDNVSIGMEYLFTSLKADKYVVRAGQGTAPATNPFLLAGVDGTDLTRSGRDLRWHSARAVLAFRF